MTRLVPTRPSRSRSAERHGSSRRCSSDCCEGVVGPRRRGGLRLCGTVSRGAHAFRPTSRESRVEELVELALQASFERRAAWFRARLSQAEEARCEARRQPEWRMTRGGSAGLLICVGGAVHVGTISSSSVAFPARVRSQICSSPTVRRRRQRDKNDPGRLGCSTVARMGSDGVTSPARAPGSTDRHHRRSGVCSNRYRARFNQGHSCRRTVPVQRSLRCVPAAVRSRGSAPTGSRPSRETWNPFRRRENRAGWTAAVDEGRGSQGKRIGKKTSAPPGPVVLRSSQSTPIVSAGARRVGDEHVERSRVANIAASRPILCSRQSFRADGGEVRAGVGGVQGDRRVG